MKTVREILEAYQHSLIKGDDIPGTTYLSKMDTRQPAKFPPEKNIPNVLTLVRKAIRVFPDNQKIALYYSQALDKYLSIPYGPDNRAMGIHLSEATQKEKEQARRKKLSKWMPKKKDQTQFAPDVSPELQAAYKAMPKKGAVTASDIVSRMHSVDAAKAGYARKKAGQIMRSNMSGPEKTGAVLGTLFRGGIEAAKRGVKKIVKEENETPSQRFQSNLQHIREARSYGKADAALDAASFIPGPAGSAASLASAGMSLSRGDYVGAALDAAGALPGVGYLSKAAKLARGAKMAKGLSKAGSLGLKSRKALKTAKAAKAAKGGKGGKLLAGLAGYGLGSMMGGGGGGNSSSSSDGGSIKDLFKQRDPAQFGNIKPELSRGTSAYDDPKYQFGARKLSATKSMQESINFKKIKTIAENKKTDSISFDNTSIEINPRMAKKIINLHESLNKDNRKKVETMLSEDVNSFRKIINFALRQ